MSSLSISLHGTTILLSSVFDYEFVHFIADAYLYIETSQPRKRGNKATLISPEIRWAGPGCLSFKAHMYGRGIGSLKVEKLEGSQRTELFEKVGNQGNKWLTFKVDLPSGGPYKVIQL